MRLTQSIREIMNDIAQFEIQWLDRPFALFAGATYYPAPGWRGHEDQFATLEEAASKGKALAEEYFGWWQVVDLRTLQIVGGE